MSHPDIPVVVVKSKPGRCAALGLARTLGRLGVAVHFVFEGVRDPVASSRYVRTRHELGALGESAQARVEALLGVGRRIGERSVLIPTDDVSTLLVAEHPELHDGFIFPHQPPRLARSLCNKRTLHELAERCGVPTPRAAFPRSMEGLEEFLDHADPPVVVKSMDPEILAKRPGARSVAIFTRRRDVLAHYRSASTTGDANLMVQEFIPGGPETVWMCNGYFDRSSTCLFGATGRKIHQYQPYTGPTTLGEVRSNEIVADTTERFMRHLGYRGIVDIGYRFDRRDGQYKLLDVNPRIGATFRLFVGEDGTDVARALYLDLTGQAVPVSRVRDGRKWIVETTELPSALTYYRDGLLDLSTWLRQLRGIEETAWFAADDPAPAAVAYRHALATALTSRRRSAARQEAADGDRAGSRSVLTRPAPTTRPTGQHAVDRFFEGVAPFWDELYADETTYALVQRHRLDMAVRWLAGMPAETAVLDVACGAGHGAAALAERGLRVFAIDRAPAMLLRSRTNALRRGIEGLIAHAVADVFHLPFPDGHFSAVVALGVLPWLDRADVAIREMARVLRPGGLIVVSVDNRLRLDHLLDPISNPVLEPLKDPVRRLLRGIGRRRVDRSTHVRAGTTIPRRLDTQLESAGIERLRGAAVGFGPYRFLGRPILREEVSVRLHRSMQRRADDGAAVLRWIGSQYMVLGRKRSPVGASDTVS